MSKVEFNQDSFGQQLIITGIARLVEEEGFTPHEAFEILEKIKGNVYFAMLDLHKEYEKNNKGEV